VTGPRLMLRLALRNLRGSARRSALTAFTIAVGMVMLVFTVGLSEGSYRRAIDTAARTGSGHVVVRALGSTPFAPRRLPDPAGVLAAVDAVPGALAAPRSRLPAFVQSSGGAGAVEILGVDPKIEEGLSILPDSLVEGEWLSVEGHAPAALVGRTLARRLDLRRGSRLVVSATTEGEHESRLVRVRGIFATGSEEIDSGLMVTDLQTAGELLGTPSVHEVAVLLPDLQKASAVQQTLREALPDLEVLRWDQALPALGDFIAMDRAGGDAMFFILFGLVALAVLNSVLMNVLRRIREFGLLLAVGARPSTLFGVVVLESTLLSVAAVVPGLIVGAGVVLYFGHVGLDLGALMGTGQAIDVGGYDISGTMYPYLPVGRTAIDVVGVILITVAAALYPAWRATRVEPVEALSHD